MEKILIGRPVEIHFHWCGYLHSKEPWKHDERTNLDYELMIGIEGKVYFNIAGNEVILAAGELLLIPPNTHFYGSRAHGNVGFYWLHFEMLGMEQASVQSAPRFNEPERWQLPLYEKNLILDNELLLLQQLQTVKEMEFPTHQLLDAYTATLLLSVKEKYLLSFQERQGEKHFLIDYVKEYLQRNYQRKITVGELANYFGYNKAYLSNLFSREVGQTVTQYLHTLRLERGRQLLLTSNYSIREVAERVGIEDEKYFSRLFQKQFQIAPRSYRKKYGLINEM